MDGLPEYFYYDGHRVLEHYKKDGEDNVDLFRQYVYGFNYIDEIVGFYAYDQYQNESLHYVMQDANYDGDITQSCGS